MFLYEIGKRILYCNIIGIKFLPKKFILSIIYLQSDG